MLRAVCVLACLAASSASTRAQASGLSAQLLEPRPEANRDLEVTIRLEDEAKVVTAASLEVRRLGTSAWHRVAALRVGADFVATIPAAEIPKPGEQLEMRAELFGKRGGLLFEIAHDEPVRVRVRSAPEAREEDRVFQVEAPSETTPEERTGVSALVAFDLRAHSRARLRASLGVSFSVAAALELGLSLSVGPAFGPPAVVPSGGPVVLGPELALRWWALEEVEALSAYLETFAGGDLRLPGFDPYAGLRVGMLWPIEPILAFDLSLGGSALVFNAVGAAESTELGFGAQLRIGVRFQEP